MTKKIVIKTCAECPHRQRHGGFGKIAYIPYCNLTKGELPHTVRVWGEGRQLVAFLTAGIPSHCPLEEDVVLPHNIGLIAQEY